MILNVRDGRVLARRTIEHAHANTYDAKTIGAIVRTHVPWRIVNGRLEPIRDGKLSGRVTRRGAPVADALVTIEIRRAADIGAGDVNWDAMKAKIAVREVRTDADGAFMLDNLVGDLEYQLSVSTGTTTLRREVFVLGPGEDPLAIELEPN